MSELSTKDGIKMKALIYNEARQLEVKEMPEPTAKENNIILKVKAASICGTDMRTFLKGHPKIDVPKIMGHECSGDIVHAGTFAQEKGFAVGDRIALEPAVGCGECWPCKTGHPNMCDDLLSFGFQYEGVFAPLVEIPERAIRVNNVIKLSDAVSYDEATLVEPAGCVLNAQHYLNIGDDDVVVIYGSGMIGCIHAELALVKGAQKVIVVEPVEKRGRMAMEKVPGIIWINPNIQNTVEEVQKLTDGRGANVVITATSVPEVHTEAQIIASKMGRISLFGGIAGESKGYLDSNLIHYKELAVYGVHATTPTYLREILALIESRQLNLQKYIERIVDIDHIMDGFQAIRDENIMKVVIHP